ncbi:hypothetical protein ACIQAD_11185 [Streptomyces sp. NPDC088551]|uniref:hypothetical protein n=1 Tax=Streptomyces sp. NPDC088551 TaxID=3365863 RepID=UPI003805C420
MAKTDWRHWKALTTRGTWGTVPLIVAHPWVALSSGSLDSLMPGGPHALLNQDVSDQLCPEPLTAPVGPRSAVDAVSRAGCWVDPADLDDLNIHPSMQLRIQHG